MKTFRCLNGARPLSAQFHFAARVLALVFAIVAPFAALHAQSNYATPYTFTTIAGSPTGGSADGTGSAARFYWPLGIAVDVSGNCYAADTTNHTIRKITAAGVVTTIAGIAGGSGSVDGTVNAARFSSPSDVAVDASGNVFVADSGNGTIRKISAAGAVTTLAGTAKNWGSTDGNGSVARFNSLRGIVVDGSGNIFAVDSSNCTIRKITSSGDVTTFAGAAGINGFSDGSGSAARFAYPLGIALDGAGNIYVADSGNHLIRKIDSAGVVTTVAGLAGSAGSTDGTGSAARFSNPAGVVVDADDNIYVGEWGNHTIRKITKAGVVTTIAGAALSKGAADGTGTVARFNVPGDIAADAAGNLFVADTYNNVIRKITIGGEVSTLAGTALTPGSNDGVGSSAQFDYPAGLALDGGGNIYVADSNNRVVRKIVSGGIVTTFAGTPENVGSADGSGSAASFNWPRNVAVDSTGNVYVADENTFTIRKITSNGSVTTFAGATFGWGATDGVGGNARFTLVTGVAVDASNNLYVADSSNRVIRKITPAGVVTTFAGTAGNNGAVDGTGSAAKFELPVGVAADASGNVFVADSGNHTIRKITSAGVVTTLAGSAGMIGSTDGIGSAARFNNPQGIAADNSGNVFVADDNHTIRRITPAGEVTTIAGMVGQSGASDGTGSSASFNYPIGLAVDGTGNIYVCDSFNNTIRKGMLYHAPTLTTQTPWQKVFAGNTATFSVTAADATDYQWEQSTDGGSTWTTLSDGGAYAGVTTAALTVSGVNSAMNGRQFRAVISNPGGSMTSTAAPLTAIATAPGLLWNAVQSTYLLSVTTLRGIDVNVAAVSAGDLHTMFVKTDGTLWAAGYNAYGQLGVETSSTTVQSTPVLVTNGVSSVATGNMFTMFIKTDGTLWGTGNNSSGQLGDGTTVNKSTPVQIATGVSSVVTGHSHSLFIKTDGTLWGMGANSYGQLGDGTTVGKSTPVQIASGVSSVSAAAQSISSYFVKTNGTLWAMGDNSYGQLGDGTTVRKTSPVQIASGVSKVTGGGQHALFLKADASLWGMGNNLNGQLGDGTTTARSSPIPITAGVTDVSAGSSHTLYVKTDSTVWGMGAYGALGTGAGSSNQLSPVQLDANCASISAGSGFSMFVRTDGTLLAVGNNLCGQLGDRESAPSQAPIDTGVMTVSNGGAYVKSDGTLWQTQGATGVQRPGVSGAIQGSITSDNQNWYLKGDGSLWSQFSQIDTNVVSFGTGQIYTVYLKSDGTLWGKGGSAGSILIGGGNDPAQIATRVVSFSAADRHILYVKDDQTLWGMGRLTSGWTDGSSPFQYVSTPVQLEVGIVSASASTNSGNRYIKVDGTLWARGDGWGASTGPAVLVDNDVVSVAISGIYTWYLKADRILRYRAGALNALGPVMEVAGGVSSVSGGPTGSPTYIQDIGFGTAPNITTQPQSVTAALGSRLTLQAVTTDGTGPMQYQWYKNGVAISWGKSEQYIIPVLLSSDIGSYTVRITNSAGVVTSSAAAVSIDVPSAPTITTQPQSQSASGGASVSFTAAANSTMAITYQWRKDGIDIPSATNPTLTLISVQAADVGSYVMVATNSVGSTPSNAATLAINELSAVRTDFNGDGKSDILLSNTATGDRAMWFMNGTAIGTNAFAGTVPTNWIVSGTGDFDGDGKADIFWTNTTTGDRAAWLMNGNIPSMGGYLGAIPVDWVVSGMGDFNGDGKSDVVWTNTATGERSLWLMNGLTASGGASLGVVPVAWAISGTGDFNGDGKTDILLSNTTTGDRVIWFMNGTTIGTNAFAGTVPPSWAVSGVGDLDGDGKADIFWTNTTTGDRAAWLMNGNIPIMGGYLGAIPVEWVVSATGDYNGDGKADILWTNTATGERAMWLMNGLTASGGASLGVVPVAWVTAR